MLDKIVSSGGDCKSFQHARRQLHKLAELDVSHTQVSRLTHQIGGELLDVRDRQSRQHRYRQLPADSAQPPVELACVETDGGRLMTRAPQQPRGVHQQQWKEPKVGVLWRMTGETFDADPHPQLPRCFQDLDRVRQLVRQIHGGSPAAEDEADEHGLTMEERTTGESSPTDRRRWQPQRVFRTCVATLRNVHGFGPLVAAEAQKRGFYQARRKVFIADGQEANWTVHRLHFREFTAVTDFMHAVAYAYTAAEALAPAAQVEQRYRDYATACWQGRVDEVIAELDRWLKQHPLPADVSLQNISDADSRKIVHESLTYFQNNRRRMNYPDYRRRGMPVTSSLVESLIKEINWRVKGSEKFWNRPDEPATSRHTGQAVAGRDSQLPEKNAESMLQVRVALLCDDERLEKHIRNRPGWPLVRRPSPLHANHAL